MWHCSFNIFRFYANLQVQKGNTGMCQPIDSYEEANKKYGPMTADNVVFTFLMPHARKGVGQMEFSRWQQNLIGVLSADIEYEDGVIVFFDVLFICLR